MILSWKLYVNPQQDENIHRIFLATWLWMITFTELKYQQIFMIDFQLYKLPLKELWKSDNEQNLNLVKLPLAE